MRALSWLSRREKITHSKVDHGMTMSKAVSVTLIVLEKIVLVLMRVLIMMLVMLVTRVVMMIVAEVLVTA